MKSSVKNFTISRYWIVTILFMAAKLLIHFLTNTRDELLRDELLFFNMGEHLSAGYATVPPVTGLIILPACSRVPHHQYSLHTKCRLGAGMAAGNMYCIRRT